MKRRLKYKGVTVNTFGLPIFSSDKKENLVPVQKRNYSFHKCFDFNFANTSPKDLIVMYDIPSDKKSEREWFLRQLKKFDYIMIQKSVWVGPSPLPKDFLAYIKSIGLLDQLRTLKLAKPYSKDEKNL